MTQREAPPHDYRPEIDGLRAIAVVPVILFHAGLPGLSGGYVGVDIFFVISGYLITNVLLKDIEEKKYSIFTFYERRARRIFPVLFLVLLVSTLLAVWLLFAKELEEYGKSAFAATLFVSNYYFMFDAGYFTGPAETKPLLHTWSLAVEEQFYIFFPIYLYMTARFLRRWGAALTAALVVCSFAYCVWLTNSHADTAFYSAPARAWELLVGSILAIALRGKQFAPAPAQGVGILGLGMIATAVFLYSETTAFPGIAAVLPVLGSALIIFSCNTKGTWVGGVLSLPPLRFVGLISYSLYLWHWPTLVFFRAWTIGPPSDVEIALLVAGLFPLSYLSWRYIETPFRRRRFLASRMKVFFASGAAMSAGLACAAVLALADGFPGRFPDHVNRIVAAKGDLAKLKSCATQDNGNGLRLCSLGAPAPTPVSFAVWGDSHGMALFPGFDVAAAKAGQRGVFAGRGGCVPLLDVNQVREGYDNCDKIGAAFLDYLSDNPDIRQVILVSRWAIYALGERFRNEQGHTVYIRDSETKALSVAENGEAFSRAFQRTMAALDGLDRQIVLVTQVPETEFDIPVAAARAIQRGQDIELRPSVADYRERQAFVTKLMDRADSNYSITFVRPESLLCTGQHCAVFDGADPIYGDTNHLTRDYALKMSPLFEPLFTASRGGEMDR